MFVFRAQAQPKKAGPHSADGISAIHGIDGDLPRGGFRPVCLFAFRLYEFVQSANVSAKGY